MKNKKTLFILILFSVFFQTATTHAAARAVFPNNSKLQPIPSPDVRPNISNNINAQLRTEEIEDTYEEPIKNYKGDEKQSAAETSDNNNSKSNFIWIVSIAVTIGLIILLSARHLLKQSTN